MWTGHDTLLLVYAALAVALIVVLIIWTRMHAFLALMIGTFFMGLAAGLDPGKVVEAFEGGVGDTLGNVGIVLALGTMLGKLLADSGGADRIAVTMLGRGGHRRIPWAMALVAAIIGIPLFFEIGVVLLIPIIFTVARRVAANRSTEGRPASSTYLLVGIPALAGLSVLHGLVPPHPGPLIAISALKADLGTTLLYGLILAIPTVIIAGPLFAYVISQRIHPEPPKELVDQLAKQTSADDAPGFGVTVGTVLLPVVLMLIRTVAELTLPSDSTFLTWAKLIGEPIVALAIAVLVATCTFGVARGFGLARIRDLLTSALGPAASILLIIGAGGGFKQMLIDSGIGKTIATAAQDTGLSLLLLAWLVAVLIRLATGSATVATITAAGIMAPLVAADPDANRALLALAIGAGSLFFSHVNDAGFWLVKEYFGMSVGQTIKSWSVMETLISVIAIVLIFAASLIV